MCHWVRFIITPDLFASLLLGYAHTVCQQRSGTKPEWLLEGDANSGESNQNTTAPRHGSHLRGSRLCQALALLPVRGD
jgi:hypothetical protein